jgi:hypothetical protein
MKHECAKASNGREWDTQDGREPDAKITVGEWKVIAYRLTGANGGYVVTKPKHGVPSVDYLDDISRHFANDSHPNTLDLRIALERVRVARSRKTA